MTEIFALNADFKMLPKKAIFDFESCHIYRKVTMIAIKIQILAPLRALGWWICRTGWLIYTYWNKNNSIQKNNNSRNNEYELVDKLFRSSFFSNSNSKLRLYSKCNCWELFFCEPNNTYLAYLRLKGKILY